MIDIRCVFIKVMNKQSVYTYIPWDRLWYMWKTKKIVHMQHFGDGSGTN